MAMLYIVNYIIQTSPSWAHEPTNLRHTSSTLNYNSEVKNRRLFSQYPRHCQRKLYNNSLFSLGSICHVSSFLRMCKYHNFSLYTLVLCFFSPNLECVLSSMSIGCRLRACMWLGWLLVIILTEYTWSKDNQRKKWGKYEVTIFLWE